MGSGVVILSLSVKPLPPNVFYRTRNYTGTSFPNYKDIEAID